jgi:hypothetical protein
VNASAAHPFKLERTGIGQSANILIGGLRLFLERMGKSILIQTKALMKDNSYSLYTIRSTLFFMERRVNDERCKVNGGLFL